MIGNRALTDGDSLGCGSVSIVVEWENAGNILDRTAMANLVNLADRVVEARDEVNVTFQLVVVNDPEASSHAVFEAVVEQLRRDFGDKINILPIDSPNAKYVDQKISGVDATDSDIIVFADSDCDYRPGWLVEILAPFGNADVDFTYGRNVMMVDSFWGKAAAVYWFYPIEAELPNRQTFLYFNNFAISRDAYRKHPFPGDPGNRVACAIWVRGIVDHGLTGEPTTAMVEHPPAYGMSGVLRRAIDYGHIDDGRYVARRMGRGARLLRAIIRLIREILHTLRRCIYVGWKLRLSPVTVLGTVAVGLVYAVVSGLTQIWAALFESPAVPKVAPAAGVATVAQDSV